MSGELEMGLRRAEQYKESLRDGRTVFIAGKKVDDVTKHPILKVCVDTASIDYEMAETPEYRDLAVVTHPDSGEPMSRYYFTPRNGEDLLKRHDLMVTATRLGRGVIPFTKDIGADAMNAVSVTAKVMGKKEYVERAENFRAYLQKNDLSMAGAMTDVKGNRSLRPSDKRQAHPDYYVRVVEKNDEGIIVRGAKVHITAAAYCNELLVMPCRNMTEEDADYAVSFAVPANAKGVTHVCHLIRAGLGAHDFPIDLPARGHTESLIIFDDVFVPWERVFLCGEWEHSMPLVYNFAYLHRHTAASYRIPISEIMLGAAEAIAEYNGVENVSHIRQQITDLAIYVNTLKYLARSSCLDYVVHEGIPIPNPVITNIAKYHFASNYHNCVKMIQDISGGLLITAPSYQDYENLETRGHIDKYLGGVAGVPTEHRLRMLQLIRLLLSLELEVVAVHAEGSLMAQRLMIYAESLPDIEKYKKWAKILAGIEKAS